MKKTSGSEVLIKCLLEEGVDTIFGYPGGAIMPIYDSLYSYLDKINHILTRHEQGAIHAAQGYSRVSGKVGVCFATSGPGATNLITGIADAQIDSTPLVCITGQVPSQLLGTDAFQESDVIGISMPVTKWNYQITSSKEIGKIISKAFYIARSGRPGPVLIDITKDAQFSEVDFNYKKCERIRSYHPYPIINDKKINEASKLINEAKKPLILVGQGVLLSNAENELIKFSEITGIPLASTLLGLSAVSCDHKNYVGYLGMHGNYGPNVKTNEADLIIAIGMRFDDRVTGDTSKYAVNAKIIHIEIDPSEIDKIIKTDVAINADAKEALIGLNKIVQKNSHEEWINEFRECDKIEYEKIIDNEIHGSYDKLSMAEVIHKISEFTKGKSIIVTDVGQHQMVTSRYYKFTEPNSNITSGGLGTMGFALPAAMGSKIGNPNRDVIAVIGDGGIQMTIQELATIAQYNIKVKILILNNNFLGMVRQWQELFFDNRYSFTEMKNPNFNKITDGYGIKNKKLEKREDLDKVIKEFIEFDGPYLLNVIVEKEENVFPMVPSGESVSNIRLE
tara:strand:+ start:4085 stop:5773 length:1689 start_codon:yes stop_codon:yes gene_type:complete